jgi:hypothetical protein
MDALFKSEGFDTYQILSDLKNPCGKRLSEENMLKISMVFFDP